MPLPKQNRKINVLILIKVNYKGILLLREWKPTEQKIQYQHLFIESLKGIIISLKSTFS